MSLWRSGPADGQPRRSGASRPAGAPARRPSPGRGSGSAAGDRGEPAGRTRPRKAPGPGPSAGRSAPKAQARKPPAKRGARPPVADPRARKPPRSEGRAPGRQAPGPQTAGEARGSHPAPEGAEPPDRTGIRSSGPTSTRRSDSRPTARPRSTTRPGSTTSPSRHAGSHHPLADALRASFGSRRPTPSRPPGAGNRRPAGRGSRSNGAGRRGAGGGPPSHDIHSRIYLVAGVVAVLALLPIWKLVGVQLRDTNDLAEQGVRQRVKPMALVAQRGSILDRNGSELAISMPRVTLGLDPSLLRTLKVRTPGEIQDFADALAPKIGLDPAALTTAIDGAKSGSRWLKLVDDLDPKEADKAIAAFKDRAVTVEAVDDNGNRQKQHHTMSEVFAVQSSTERVHPAGDSALRVIGTVGPDGPGPRAGIEKIYDKELRGTPGEKVVERGPKGAVIAGGETVTKSPVAGSNVELTLDRTMQFETEQLLSQGAQNASAASGIAIVGRPTTGEILAVAGVERDPTTGNMALASGPTAFTNAYQAGSVFKLVTVSAATEAGIVNANSTFTVPDHIQVADRTFTDNENHPTQAMSVQQIVAESSNVGTIEIAQQLGKERLYNALKAFGFGTRTGVASPAESSGILPPLSKWTEPDVAASAIGTHQSATPIQLWSAYNVIANNGRYVAPRLVDSTIDPDGTRHPVPSTPSHEVISRGHGGTGGDGPAGGGVGGHGQAVGHPRIPGGRQDRDQPDG